MSQVCYRTSDFKNQTSGFLFIIILIYLQQQLQLVNKKISLDLDPERSINWILYVIKKLF
jgi:hypothetical protein